MLNFKENVNKWWIRILYTIIIAFLIFGAMIIYSEWKTYNDVLNSMEEDFLKSEKDSLKREVSNRLDEIEYELENIESNLKELIKTKINNLYIEIEGDLANNKEMSKEEKIELAKQVLISHDESDNNYVYIMLDINGNLVKSGIDSTLNGINMIDSKDKNGKYYVKDIIKKVKENEEAFVTYSWPKKRGGVPKQKTTYFKYISEIDVIIGTGIYHEDLEKDLQNEIYNRFQEYYLEKSEYLFIVGYDGIAKVFGQESLIGKDITEIEDKDGNPLHDKFMNISDNTKGAGFIKYEYYKRGNTEEKFTKLSYIIRLEEWKSYIGLGFYLDEFYDKIEERKVKYISSLVDNIILMIIVLAISTVILVNLILKAISRNKEIIAQEEMLYEKSFQLTEEIIIITLPNGIIQFSNTKANEILGINSKKKKLEEYIDLTKKINSFENNEGREYYFKMNSDTMKYNGQEYNIYFLKDITYSKMYEKNLEEQAMIDQLTGVPNRRKFMNDLDVYLDKLKRDEVHFSIGIIDLDNFKQVNDNYGHNIGDRVLKKLGEIFNEYTREGDKIYRFGGEEFTVIFSRTELKKSKRLLERINKKMKEYKWEPASLKVTFSGGLVEVCNKKDVKDKEFYIKKADNLLYKAKDNGKDRIEIQEVCI